MVVPFELMPIAAVSFVGDRPAHANELAAELLGLTGESAGDLGLDDAFEAGLYDDATKDALRGLVREPSTEPVRLRWGGQLPVLALLATATRVDEDSVIVALIDDREAQRLDAILTAYNNGVFVTDDEQRMQWMSRGTVEAYGEPFELGTDAAQRVHPDDQTISQELFDTSVAHPRRKERRSMRVSSVEFPDVYWMIDVVGLSLLDDPAVAGVAYAFGPHADTPDQGDRDPEAMRLSDVMPVGVVQAMPDGRCYYRNRYATEQLGDIPLGSAAEDWIQRADHEHRDALHRAMKEALAGNRSEPVLAAFARATGTAWFRIEFHPQFDMAHQPAGSIATSLDVTAEVEAQEELERARQRLWHLAHHDALTGLPNRPSILERVEAALARAEREPHGVALLFCDLDGFKPVNDRHGHEAGDDVLRTVAQRMLDAARETDSVGRIGGDEFVILCESFDSIADVEAIASRLTSIVAAPIAVGDPAVEITIGVTIGVAVAEPHETSDALVARADKAMYTSKPGR